LVDTLRPGRPETLLLGFWNALPRAWRARLCVRCVRQGNAPAAFLRATMAATSKSLARSSKSCAAVSATNRRATARRSSSQAPKTRCVRAALPPFNMDRHDTIGAQSGAAVVTVILNRLLRAKRAARSKALSSQISEIDRARDGMVAENCRFERKNSATESANSARRALIAMIIAKVVMTASVMLRKRSSWLDVPATL
jgi:hypothetical protein